MTDDFAPDDTTSEIASRLGHLGAQPVDPKVQGMHLQTMASVRIRRHGLREKFKVAAALAAGFMLGSTGLAFAGALPAPAQDAASETLARVGVSVPVGTERYFGEECAAGETGNAKNRGQYLKQERAKGEEALAAAKASTCGKPLSSLNKTDDESDDAPESETPKADKCVDGVKVTGKADGKGKSAAKDKAAKACDTPEAGTLPAPSDDGVEDDQGTEEGAEKANPGKGNADKGNTNSETGKSNADKAKSGAGPDGADDDDSDDDDSDD